VEDKDSEEITPFLKLYNIVGGFAVTDEQRQQAWQQLLLIGDIHLFSILIAAKFSWIKISDEDKEKAWQELLKRGIQDDDLYLNYLSVNAPEPWCKRARELKDKLQE